MNSAIQEQEHARRAKLNARYILIALVCALGLTILPGCALFVVGSAAAAAAGGYAYVKGELKGTEDVSFDRAWTATEAAMKDLQYAVTKEQKGTNVAQLIARTRTDKRVELNLSKVSDKSTEFRIRVGTFGDEALSRTIMDQIKKHF